MYSTDTINYCICKYQNVWTAQGHFSVRNSSSGQYKTITIWTLVNGKWTVPIQSLSKLPKVLYNTICALTYLHAHIHTALYYISTTLTLNSPDGGQLLWPLIHSCPVGLNVERYIQLYSPHQAKCLHAHKKTIYSFILYTKK